MIAAKSNFKHEETDRAVVAVCNHDDDIQNGNATCDQNRIQLSYLEILLRWKD
jgi:hypothetical protein